MFSVLMMKPWAFGNQSAHRRAANIKNDVLSSNIQFRFIDEPVEQVSNLQKSDEINEHLR